LFGTQRKKKTFFEEISVVKIEEEAPLTAKTDYKRRRQGLAGD
jgi:hypothetical protein